MTLSYGLYANGDVDYHTLAAVNQSSLKPLIQRSPKHYLYNLNNPRPSTRSQFRGTAAHCAILEPERFARDFVVFDGPRRAGKAWEAFEAANEGKTILKVDELEAARAIQRAVLEDPLAGRYFSGCGDNEATLYWRDVLTGLECKARPDRMTSIGGEHVIVDLKGTKDASPKWFPRDAANYLYHLQAAFYSDGYEAVVGVRPRYVIVAVELAAPHDVVVYQLDEDTLAAGRETYREALQSVAACRKAEQWPGAAGGAEMVLELPSWAFPREDDLEGMDLDWGEAS